MSLLMDVVTPPHKPCGERNALKESQSTASTAEQSYVVLNGPRPLVEIRNSRPAQSSRDERQAPVPRSAVQPYHERDGCRQVAVTVHVAAVMWSL